MLAFKLQKLTTRTLLRPSHLRFVQGSTTIIRTYNHGWKIINNPKQHRKLPLMVPSVTHEKSPRVRSNERQGSNNRDSEKASPEEDFGLVELFFLGLFIVACCIIEGMAEIHLTILFQKLGLMGPSPVLKDVMGVIGEDAMWLDQYMREDGERKPGKYDER